MGSIKEGVKQVLEEVLGGSSGHRRLVEFLETASEKLQSKPLVELSAEKVFFIGDLHGDYTSFKSSLDFVHEGVVVYLGDYVDRGPRQLEVLTGVLAARSEEPSRIILLRGNHESPFMNSRYGFIATLRRRYGSEWKKVYEAIMEFVYKKLPVMLVVKHSSLVVAAVHGGVPIEAPTLGDIARLPLEVDPVHPLLIQLLWNDPSGTEEDLPSVRGPGIYMFGERTFNRFMEENGLTHMVRAHEPVNGVSKMYGGRLYTVFSCRYYGITPAALALRDGEFSTIYLR